MISRVEGYEGLTEYNTMILRPLRCVSMKIHAEQHKKKGVRGKIKRGKIE